MFARIQRASGEIDLPEWMEVISSHPALEHAPDRTGINPFTNEPVVFPGIGKAYYVLEGARVGNAAFADGEILTTGIPGDVCEEIAAGLNADVFEHDDS